ncbi:hypothetical protein ABB30_01890 [Stenotrophomonas ginsengisoli]|uniref:UPF0301 protein ABB30_01890 n=1 Tax=Stenotrophomonas ginsengisoli TaxID=336566 RepID=A0A0R0DBU6_9GAMM|nr:YqgE/AlgH family protein [Stenotrophomonas ginsengisoli]KRG79174.1 hypothetical protein ABB30_01890 [Stenotrophomonas ginsengisoli]
MSSSTLALTNHLLVAAPSLQQEPFARGVALICQHDDQGAMGVLVNQPSEYTLGDVFEQIGLHSEDADLQSVPVLNGGPVHTERGFVIHDDARHWSSSLTVADGLFLTTSRDILQAMAEGHGPRNALVALGCAGWGPGQLETELGENSWLTVPNAEAILFELPLDKRWQGAAGLLGFDMAHLTDYSGRA